jgi:hypothetical protein
VSTSTIHDAEHWRKCAEQSRATAERMRDVAAKESMFRIAEEYERLAMQAEKRQRSNNSAA